MNSIVINSLAGLLGLLKPDGVPSFPLADRRSIGSIAVRGGIFQRNCIAGAVAADRRLKIARSRVSSLRLKLPPTFATADKECKCQDCVHAVFRSDRGNLR
jgi:hypothetical protein